MSEAEVLQDIVSYHPGVVGISMDTPTTNYTKILGKDMLYPLSPTK